MVKKYEVVVDETWINEMLLRKGDTVELTDAQAKHYVAPYGDQLRLWAAPGPAAAPAAKGKRAGA